MSNREVKAMLRYCLVLMLGVTAVPAGRCAAEEYLLRMEELAAGATEMAPFAESPGVGWLDEANDGSKAALARVIEMRISTASPFQLALQDQGDRVELRGEIEKQQQPTAADPQQPSDLLIRVTYQRTREKGARAEMASLIPIRFGKKWYLRGPRGFPITLWSVEKVASEHLGPR